MNKKILAFLFLPLLLTSCGKKAEEVSSLSSSTEEKDLGEEDRPNEERDILVAEAGYDYYLPEYLTHYANHIVLHYEDGSTLPIESPYCLSGSQVKLGNHNFTYQDLKGEEKTTPFHVIDSEAPHFQSLWTSYSHKDRRPLYVPKNHPVDLNDIFRVKDNADPAPSTWFEVYHNEVEKVELTGHKASIFTPEKGYYYVYAHAKDASGNAILQEQRIDLSMSPEELDKDYTHAVFSSGTRGFGIQNITGETTFDASKTYKVTFELYNYNDGVVDLNLNFSINGTSFLTKEENNIPYRTWTKYEARVKPIGADVSLSLRYQEAKTETAGFYFLIEGISSGDISLIRNLTILEA